MDFQDMLAEEKAEGIELGRSQGIEQEKINNISNIMKNVGSSYEEACAMLGLTHMQMSCYKDKVLNA